MIAWLVKQAHVQNPFPKSNRIGSSAVWRNDLGIIMYYSTYSLTSRMWKDLKF